LSVIDEYRSVFDEMGLYEDAYSKSKRETDAFFGVGHQNEKFLEGNNKMNETTKGGQGFRADKYKEYKDDKIKGDDQTNNHSVKDIRAEQLKIDNINDDDLVNQYSSKEIRSRKKNIDDYIIGNNNSDMNAESVNMNQNFTNSKVVASVSETSFKHYKVKNMDICNKTSNDFESFDPVIVQENKQIVNNEITNKNSHEIKTNNNRIDNETEKELKDLERNLKRHNMKRNEVNNIKRVKTVYDNKDLYTHNENDIHKNNNKRYKADENDSFRQNTIDSRGKSHSKEIYNEEQIVLENDKINYNLKNINEQHEKNIKESNISTSKCNEFNNDTTITNAVNNNFEDNYAEKKDNNLEDKYVVNNENIKGDDDIEKEDLIGKKLRELERQSLNRSKTCNNIENKNLDNNHNKRYNNHNRGYNNYHRLYNNNNNKYNNNTSNSSYNNNNELGNSHYNNNYKFNNVNNNNNNNYSNKYNNTSTNITGNMREGEHSRNKNYSRINNRNKDTRNENNQIIEYSINNLPVPIELNFYKKKEIFNVDDDKRNNNNNVPGNVYNKEAYKLIYGNNQDSIRKGDNNINNTMNLNPGNQNYSNHHTRNNIPVNIYANNYKYNSPNHINNPSNFFSPTHNNINNGGSITLPNNNNINYNPNHIYNSNLNNLSHVNNSNGVNNMNNSMYNVNNIRYNNNLNDSNHTHYNPSHIHNVNNLNDLNVYKLNITNANKLNNVNSYDIHDSRNNGIPNLHNSYIINGMSSNKNSNSNYVDINNVNPIHVNNTNSSSFNINGTPYNITAINNKYYNQKDTLKNADNFLYEKQVYKNNTDYNTNVSNNIVSNHDVSNKHISNNDLNSPYHNYVGNNALPNNNQRPQNIDQSNITRVNDNQMISNNCSTNGIAQKYNENLNINTYCSEINYELTPRDTVSNNYNTSSSNSINNINIPSSNSINNNFNNNIISTFSNNSNYNVDSTLNNYANNNTANNAFNVNNTAGINLFPLNNIKLLLFNTQCKNCGLRFASQDKYTKHASEHQRKARILDTVNSIGREYFASIETFTNNAERIILELPEKEDTPRIKAENAVCSVCKEKIQKEWCEDDDEWVMKDCVKVGEKKYCHR
ncbi:mRNA 3' end processing factor, partial [Conglomerata obtusa]